jgi:hypothetical protein
MTITDSSIGSSGGASAGSSSGGASSGGASSGGAASVGASSGGGASVGAGVGCCPHPDKLTAIIIMIAVSNQNVRFLIMFLSFVSRVWIKGQGIP